MGEPDSSSALASSASLVIARIFYGVNWFNIGAIFPLIALEFGQDLSLLGAVTSAFLIGVGLFQIPSGIFASRFGLRMAAIFGIAVSSAASLATGLVSEASQLVWLRFIVGLGMAFFFSSSMILIASYSSSRRPAGFSIGIMNSAHSMGGIIGIFAWILVADIVGWRTSLILSGAIGLATALLLVITIPKEKPVSRLLPTKEEQKRKPMRKSEVYCVLTSRPLLSLGLVLTGVQVSWAITLTFIVVYLQTLHASVEQIGIIASLSLIAAIISAPLIGRIYDSKIQDARKILLICASGIGLGMATLSVPNLSTIALGVVVIGFFGGGAFTVAYAKARKTTPSIVAADGKEELSTNTPHNSTSSSGGSALNVAWVNGFSLLGVLWMPLVFSFVVQYANGGGYPLAWLLSAIVGTLFATIPLLWTGK